MNMLSKPYKEVAMIGGQQLQKNMQVNRIKFFLGFDNGEKIRDRG